MKQIPLTRGGVALVDDADYETLPFLKNHSWHQISQGYAACRISPIGRRPGRPSANDKTPRVKTEILLMHRYIMGATPSDGSHIHHRNENRLDNRRENLEYMPARKHAQLHTKKVGKIEHVPSGRWRARGKLKGKIISLGTFDTEQEAQDAVQSFYDAVDLMEAQSQSM